MTIITLDSIALKLLSSSNCPPPDDLQLVIKLVTGNNVVIESKPSAMSTGSEKLWTSEIQFEFPADCTSISIENSCTIPSQRKAFQLESVHLNASNIVAKADNKECFPLHLYVNSVDGVLSFHLRADFSIGSIQSEPQSTTIESNAGFPFNDETIRSSLLRMYPSQTAGPELDSNILNDLQRSIQLLPNTHPMRSTFLTCVGDIYMEFHQYESEDALDKVVDIYEDAKVNALGNDTQTPIHVGHYGYALRCRFQQKGIVDDINKSVSALEDAVRLTPDGHSDKPSRLNNLGSSLLRRFQRLGDLSDINMSVSVFEDTVRLTPDGQHSSLNNLGYSLLCRFERLGDLSDINMSVSVFQDAGRLTPDDHPDKLSSLSNLGSSLLRRFQRLGDLSDINMSVSVIEDAVRLTPDGHPDKPSRLNNFGISFLRRFERLGDLSDINMSVSVTQDAVDLTPDGHLDKPPRLHNLGNSFFGRFQCHGKLSDINMSVSVNQDAVRLTPDGHPDKPSRLTTLGGLLLHRFDRLGELSDINMSVSVIEEAVRLTAVGHPNMPSSLTNLGSSLLRRFQRLGDLSDINMSVSVIEDAVRLTPDGHPDKPSRLNNFGISFLRRFERLGDLSDINMSVSVTQAAVGLTPDGHPHKPPRLHNLGNSFFGRFQRIGDLSDINMSVSVIQDAVRLTPDGHPDKPSKLTTLGESLLARFQRLQDASDIKLAGAMFEKAGKSSTGLSSIQFRACSLWATYCQLYDPCSLLHAYSHAFRLLPSMAWLSLSIADRHHFLQHVGPVVGDAVSAAIDTNQCRRAIEWMDQGHSVIWGQLLQLRTPVDDLRQHHPDVAVGFTIISRKLEEAGAQGAGASDDLEAPNNFRTTSCTSEDYHKLAEERDRLVRHIRGLDGFDRFLLPRKFSQLRMAARNGPVVSINVSKLRCDALILMPDLDDIHHVPLEKFTHGAAEMLYRHLRILVERKGRTISYDMGSGTSKARNGIHISHSGAEAAFEHILSQTSKSHEVDCAGGIVPLSTSATSDPETEFQTILAHLWHTVVKPILDALAISVTGDRSERELPRVWWCTTGFLTFLPIHAAGIYGEKAFPGSKLADFVVSSYTPTLSHLITDFRPRTIPNSQVLAVALPVESELSGTAQELDCVANRVGSSNIRKLLEKDATIDNVIAGLKESSFVHFACHGVQDPINPIESALLLAESSRLTLSRLNHLSLPHAQLAFLSACQTATGDERLVQEAVHLAAGMLSAGYRGVIATMWSIMDSDAPQVADEVYAQLFKDMEPDPTQAAHALHNAVQKLIEDSNGTKSLFEWVPFIHIGI